MKIFALILFIVTYLALLAFSKQRAYIAFGSALIYVIFGIMPFGKILSTVNWNVLLMLAGTMGTVYLFIESKMPSLLADLLMKRMPNVKWAIVSLALFAGVISAFIDNVATVLMVAPVALNVCKKMKVSPVASIIAIAVSSNLQGAATLVGDTTSIMLGGYAGMNFLNFFVFKGKISMFFVVEAGALASMFILLFLFRKEKQPIEMKEKTVVTDYFPSILLSGTVLLLIIASFLNIKFELINGVICVSVFLIGLIREYFKNKNFEGIKSALKEIDYFTLLLLGSLFIVIGSITEVGIINDISKIFVKLSNNNLFLIYTLIVWASVILSAFIDNIPYVATMLPVAAGIANIMGVDPVILYFGLLCGATLGGNLTPIGASANIAGLGILRKEGYEVKAKEFMKIGVPFTLVAVTVGYILIWLIWA